PCYGIPKITFLDGCNATLNSHLARLAASRSLAYVIAHAAIIITINHTIMLSGGQFLWNCYTYCCQQTK
ncbi:hypothetical protein L9F63_022409, partial [Diploptera punctata]